MSKKSPVRGILIVALKRSGTTILWETFRKDSTNCCFDEPFHPRLWEGRRENRKGTWKELGALWDEAGGLPVRGLQPIEASDELKPEFTEEQSSYLKLLLDQGDRVVLDEVRVWNKLQEILRPQPPVLVVHLVRHPLSWVSSHLLPSGGSGWKRSLGNLYRETTFFSRKGNFDHWRYESIIEEALSLGHSVWAPCQVSPEELAAQPAYVKLLAFWWGAVSTAASALSAAGETPVMTVTLEEFSRSPGQVMARIYERAGWETPGMSLDHIRPVRSGWKSEARHWDEACARLGIPGEVFRVQPFDGAAIERALEKLVVVQ